MPDQQYEFRVAGRLSERAQRACGAHGEMHIITAPPETIIYAEVTDDAHLQGILVLLANLGLHVVSMNRVPELPD